MAARKDNILEKREKGDQGESIIRFHDMMMQLFQCLNQNSYPWDGQEKMETFFFFQFLALNVILSSYYFIYLFICWSCCMAWHMGSQFPNQG